MGPLARPSGHSVCWQRAVPAAPALPASFPPPPSQKSFRLDLSQEFGTRISFLPSASFPGWPASLSLRGRESIFRRRLPCLLGGGDFVFQATRSINERSLYRDVY